MSENKITAPTYPSDSLYEIWRECAKDRNTTISQYIIRMVEAGRQEIDSNELTNDSFQELRQLPTDLHQDLGNQRERVREIEKQLHNIGRVDILEYVEENFGAQTQTAKPPDSISD